MTNAKVRSVESMRQLRRIVGIGMVGAAIIGVGLVAGALVRLLSPDLGGLGHSINNALRNAPALALVTTAYAAQAPSLTGSQRSLLAARQWLNTAPLRAEDIQGKVVLVNFWTYTCINSLRALPFVRSWAEKYKDRGLVVVGVHTPEFTFEKDFANVTAASGSLGVTYPVALDSDYGIWRSFNNEAWPAFYFIGADGRVRDHAYGEGGYDQSERELQTLLTEATGTPVKDAIAPITGIGSQAPADQRNEESPETYVGYGQAENFASPGGFKRDTSNLYRFPSELDVNRWSLSGTWTTGREFASLDEKPGKLAYRFHSRDLHLILAPPADGRPIRFRVTIDGAPPGADHGVDVDAEGLGVVKEPRMYQMIRQSGKVADRTFEIEFLDSGVRAYDFTFG